MVPMDVANAICWNLQPPLAAEGPVRRTRWDFEECKCDWWEVSERDNGLIIQWEIDRKMARWQDREKARS